MRAISLSQIENCDPLFAPFLKCIRNTWYWIPPRKDVERGFGIKSHRIGSELTEAQRAEICRSLAIELVQWRESGRSEPDLSTRNNAVLDRVCDTMKGVRQRAARRGIQFHITREDLRSVLLDQGWRCALTGAAFTFKVGSGKSFRNPTAPSIDRIENSLGYIPENIRVVTVIANIARADYTDKQFYDMCRAASRFHDNS